MNKSNPNLFVSALTDFNIFATVVKQRCIIQTPEACIATNVITTVSGKTGSKGFFKQQF
eukprot:COSAG01_NODE_72075_length_254_cov_0.658065_1_plen_58_part_10